MDLSFLADPSAWVTLVTLSGLEVVLGVDNLVFISIAVGRLPEARRSGARRIGIAVACITRILLLVSLAYLARMNDNLFTIAGQGISIRDLVLIVGGAFLLVKGTMEIRELISGGEDEDPRTTRASSAFGMVILQIAIIDIVFSLDSVITAVGMAANMKGAIPIMVTAVLVAVAMMLLAANPMGRFIDANPTVKMLALAFILLIGVVLILDGLGVHVPKPYIYFAMGFSVLVEWLNQLMRRSARTHRVPGSGDW
ncbi:MAG: TerC family protein [Xanthomonadales bacterium]|nr:TerC family protein [Xanthomonadales bacterium]